MPTGSGVTVVGSANLDLVLGVAALPVAGQTVLSTRRSDGPGGKGLNQAVAAARAGVPTHFIGAVGDDREGDLLLSVLIDDGIVPLVRRSGARTGLALVMVDALGENAIVVAPGANAELLDLDATEVAAVTRAGVVLLQLEVPMPTVTEAARAARDAGTTVVLNAAPASALDRDLTDCVDVLVVNEGEARAIATGPAATEGSTGGRDDQLTPYVDRLLERVPAVVVTLGARGALYRDRSGAEHHEPGSPVRVVDTTGAGDCFAGYLAAALADGAPVAAAMALGNAAAALCVQRPGAVPAVPTRAEVDAVLPR